MDYDALVCEYLAEALDLWTRRVYGQGGDAIDFGAALAPRLRGLADCLERIAESWRASGGDPGIAEMISGTQNLTEEELCQWLAGTPLHRIIRSIPGPPGDDAAGPQG